MRTGRLLVRDQEHWVRKGREARKDSKSNNDLLVTSKTGVWFPLRLLRTPTLPAFRAPDNAVTAGTPT